MGTLPDRSDSAVRQAKLSAGLPGGIGIEWVYPLTWEAEVEMTRSSAPNKLKATIFNLGPASLKMLDTKGVMIRLLAGEPAASLIFQGDVLTKDVTTKRVGADWATEITARDGGRKYLESRFNKAYPAGTAWSVILADAAAGLGYPIGYIGAGFPSSGTTTGPWVMMGTARAAMDSVCGQFECGWWIENGKIYVLGSREGMAVGQVPLLSPETGLIGAPEKQKGAVKTKSILLPTMRPGGFYVVKSRFITGGMVASKATHKVNSACSVWETSITGAPR